MSYERACTAHMTTPREAETFTQHGLTYLMLRCPNCDRPRGQRLLRKKDRL